ncbi:hypothetical protein [Oceanobacillus sp. FSL K6-0251]
MHSKLLNGLFFIREKYIFEFHDVKTPVVEETLKVIAIEVNTSGKNKD